MGNGLIGAIEKVEDILAAGNGVFVFFGFTRGEGIAGRGFTFSQLSIL
jgi:hypothetical protein